MSTPDTFRDALAARFDPAVQAMKQKPEHSYAEYCAEWDRTMADAVLASDEMQAIRKALWVLAAHYALTGPDDDTMVDVRAKLMLPESVIAWVLDDPSPDSPADKPCETCGGTGKLPIYVLGSVQGASPCPSCRGGEHQ